MIGSRRCGDHRSSVRQQRLDAIQNAARRGVARHIPVLCCTFRVGRDFRRYLDADRGQHCRRLDDDRAGVLPVLPSAPGASGTKSDSTIVRDLPAAGALWASPSLMHQWAFMRLLDGARRSSDSPYREISAIACMDSPSFAKLVPCLTSEFVDNQTKCGFTPNKKRGRRVMLLKLRRITAVLTAALTLAAASIPTNVEAQGFYGPGYVGAGGWGRGAWDGGGGWGGGGWGGCGCCCRRVWVPPPPPPPPCCCCGGYGYGGGGYGGVGYGGVGYGGVGYGGGGYGGW